MNRLAYKIGLLDGMTAKIQLEEMEKDRQNFRAPEGMSEAEMVDCIHKIGKSLHEAQVGSYVGSASSRG